ncbi:hypothetical protein [Micromonospora sp. MH33]|uniref:hypothetical protein n=1 Tax=Micromonospora sp. MH33 TaxID=1945509 RepID=UPI0011B26861|nr:hypothetical protein [Micromonospora sp. MH33]
MDIGAGTGLGTLVAARAVPDAEVIAVEPSPILRAALLARVVGDEDPRRRADLRPRLDPAAPLVVTLQPPSEPMTVPETTFASVPIGRHSYEGSGGARPAGPDSVIWTMRYRVIDEDGAVERELVADYLVRPLRTATAARAGRRRLRRDDRGHGRHGGHPHGLMHGSRGSTAAATTFDKHENHCHGRVR